MAGLIPFNHRHGALTRGGLDDFYNVLDDFFNFDNFMPGRSLNRDTFKIDIEERENEYVIEAELPGIAKEEIDLNIDDDSLCISVNRAEEVNKDGKNYLHRERRVSSMSRRVRLSGADLSDIKAKLENGVLCVSVPKEVKSNQQRKIDIQ